MPKREDDIRDEIQRLDDEIFERFVIELLSRELYPGLNPTSRTYDLGEDARTEPTTLFLHNGQWISLAASKESGWGKIKKDCTRCKETGRIINILVYVTAGNPRTDTIKRWKEDVGKLYEWILEVHTIDFLAPFASRTEYENLVDDYLSIPPLNGDYIQDIEEKLDRITSHNLNQIRNTIPGLQEPFPRNEVADIEEKLLTGKNVVITGDAGTGKSGIVAFLVNKGVGLGKKSILFDARQFGRIQSNGELRNHFDFKGPPHKAIQRLGHHNNLRLIIDQLDNIAGLPSSDLILGFIEDLEVFSAQIEIIAVCRNKEAYEHDLLRRLLKNNFDEVICKQISDDDVKRILSLIGINNDSQEVVDFCKNFLNLDLIAQIRFQEPEFNFSILKDEVQLWEKYIEVWRIQEGRVIGDEMLYSAIKLAKLGLNHPDCVFDIGFPQAPSLQRLISWDIITPIEGQVFRFRHEKFQDFIYSKDATDRLLMPSDILSEILQHKSFNVFKWVDSIYTHRNSPMRLKFLEEVFNVQ